MRLITLICLALLCSFAAFGQTLKHRIHVPRIFAVVVGVNNAAEEKGDRLKYAEQDAAAFAKYLKSPGAGAVSLANIQLLTGTAATRLNILQAVKNTFDHATGDDLVIFYFSGHGLKGEMESEGYLIPSDYVFGLASSGVPMKQLLASIDHSRAKMKEVFIDACHAGLFQDNGVKGTPADQNAALSSAFLASFNAAGDGFIGVLSSNGSEESREDPSLKHGIFTHFLLKGLSGEAAQPGKSVINISDLESYLSRRVWTFTDNKQHPKFIYSIPNFPLSVIRLDKNLKDLIKENPGIVKQVQDDAKAPKLKKGKIFTDAKFSYGYVNFINQTDRDLHIYRFRADVLMGGGFNADILISDLNIDVPAGSTVSSGKLIVLNKSFGRGQKVSKYNFFIESKVGDTRMYSQFTATVNVLKENDFIIGPDDLDFSPKKP